MVVWVSLFWRGFPLEDEISHWILMLFCTIKIMKSPVGFRFFFVAQLQRWGLYQKESREGASFVSLIGGEPIFHILTIVMDF